MLDVGGGGDVEEEVLRRVQVWFVAKLKAPLKAPNTSISIQSNLTRLGLSAVLNSLLKASAVPRKEEEPSLRDDWVNAVDGSNPRFVLTGCYEGLGRVWKGAGICTHILEGHNNAITSVSIINKKVFYDHIYDFGIHDIISELIEAQKRAVIHCRSPVKIFHATSDGYAAQVGDTLVMKLGHFDWNPSKEVIWMGAGKCLLIKDQIISCG